MRTRSLLPVALLLSAAARADVLHVPKDFPSIQAAVDAAEPGDDIVVAAGNYEGAVEIEGKEDLTLRGQGKVTLHGSDPLLPVVSVVASSFVSLEHLTIDQAPDIAVSLVSSGFVTLQHARIEAPVGDAISISDCGFVVIAHVLVKDAGADGLSADSSFALTLGHCTFDTGGGRGVFLDDGESHFLEKVTVRDTVDSAIVIDEDVSGSILRKCVVKGTGQHGIEVHGSDLLVERNRILDASLDGLSLAGGSGCVADHNRIVGAGARGVFVVGAHQVLDNRIVKPAQAGVVAAVNGSSLLSGNRVLKSGADGLIVDVGADACMLLGNKVAAPADDGIEVAAADVEAEGNKVHGAGEDGFQVTGPGGLFVGNKATGSGEFDLLDASGSQSTYVDNTFGTIQIQ